MKDLAIALENRPGALAEMGDALGRAGVSIEGGGAFVVNGQGVAHFLFTDGAAARRTLEAAGIRFETLQPEASAKFKDLMKGVAKAWSEGLDGRGKRGSDALKEFDAAVAAIPAK